MAQGQSMFGRFQSIIMKGRPVIDLRRQTAMSNFLNNLWIGASFLCYYFRWFSFNVFDNNALPYASEIQSIYSFASIGLLTDL